MSGMRKTPAMAPLPHERGDDESYGWDGLVGKTAAERRRIADRIARLKLAKAAAWGRELPPSVVDAIFGDAGTATPPAADPDPVPAKPCLSTWCRGFLVPLTEFYFREDTGAYDCYCRPCRAEMAKRRRRTPAARAYARAAWRKEENRERNKARCKARYARAKASGDIAAEYRTPRHRLIQSRSKCRSEIGRTEDPAKVAHLEARILNLTAEIDRIDRIDRKGGQ